MTVYTNYFAANDVSDTKRHRASSFQIKKTPQNNQMLEFLSTKTVSDFIESEANTLPKANELVFAETSMDVLDAYKRICLENHFQSGPCIKSTDKTCVGFLDVKQLVEFVMFCYQEETNSLEYDASVNIKRPREEEVSGSAGASPKAKKALTLAGLVSESKKDGINVEYLAKTTAFFRCSENDSLLTLAKVLMQVHRVCVVKPNSPRDFTKEDIVTILTQSNFLKYLKMNQVEFPSTVGNMIKHTNIGRGEGFNRQVYDAEGEKNDKQAIVYLCNATDKAITVFKKMSKYGLSAIPVVDANGKLVANVSNSDMRLFLDVKEPNLDMLRQMDIWTWLKKIRQTTDVLLPTRVPLITVNESESVEKLISKMVATRLHHIFVVDENTAPDNFQLTRVVSLSDVFRYLLIENDAQNMIFEKASYVE